MPHILGSRLKFEFEKLGLNKSQFEKTHKLGRKQLGEHLKHSDRIEVNENTAVIYQRAFKRTLEDLQRPPATEDRKNSTPTGWTRIAFPVSENDRMILKLTALRYNVEVSTILRMSAALFTIVAELQLSDRRRQVAEMQAQLDAFPTGLRHLAATSHGQGEIMEALESERTAIEVRDLSGSSFRDYEWNENHEGSGDLFDDFLDQKLEELAPDIYRHSGVAPCSDLFGDLLDDMCQGDQLGRMVLLKGDVQPRDVLNLPAQERVAYLHEHCRAETRAAFDEHEALLASLDLDFDFETDAGDDDA
ncbi:hypothetical protein [Donghicola mangrovi]|uniref:Uncharacterized protein n=1 Tax=Donghicola mangrovi TaxID=2729614 RepID=A0A850QGN4_9RHOB|nr:hypothetical protein [Donghicola mangrovi]NVO24991.1 hypothetical protein [Donghicola mangrovi]